MSHILENTTLTNFDTPHQISRFSPPETHVFGFAFLPTLIRPNDSGEKFVVSGNSALR